MSTADDTSVAERRPRVVRETQQFGTIVVVGGGCYGNYYVRQLGRAHAAGAAEWESLVVVDREADCLVSRLDGDDRPPRLRVEVATWGDFFARYLANAAEQPEAVVHDAIVPSPLMPHLMAEWIVARSKERWPSRRVSVEPLPVAPAVPWERAGDDGTHYVSFAEWVCPINCIEPATCPATKGPRSWSMPPAIARFAETERTAGRPVEGPFVFHCSHRTHGVGMIDVRDVVSADASVAVCGADHGIAFLVGTASHCHGAIQRIVVGD